MNRQLVLSLALVLAGCEPERTGDELHIPTDLKDLWNNALACRSDVAKVPLEHSEHCVILGETLLETTRAECVENHSSKCQAFSDAWGRISTIYDQAIIDSLLIHGPSPEIVRATDKTSGSWLVYYSQGKLLRRLFNQCLADEDRNLRAQGLGRVSSIRQTPLERGQLCFRKGYPEFRTKNAELS